jgi:hypothetical protein
MKVERFLHVKDIIDKESKQALASAEKPTMVSRAFVPMSLDLITFGQYLDLKRLKTDEDVLFVPAQVLLGLTIKQVMREDIRVVYGFSKWVCEEVSRINDMFARCNQTPTAEERAAGVERLQFGDFGMIDWYAQRMGIQDHDEVLKVSWRRVYQVMKNDSEVSAYRKRLEQEYSKKNK